MELEDAVEGTINEGDEVGLKFDFFPLVSIISC